MEEDEAEERAERDRMLTQQADEEMRSRARAASDAIVCDLAAVLAAQSVGSSCILSETSSGRP